MPFPNAPTQFQRGQSGNPDGYSRSRRATKALRDLIESGENAEILAKALFEVAKTGDVRAISLIYDRLDGKPIQPIETDARDWTLAEEVEAAKRIADSFKPDEPPQ